MRKKRNISAAIKSVFCIIFSALMLCSCSITERNGKDELLESFLDNLTETSTETKDTVFWTSGGKVYHLRRDCRFLRNSEEIRSGTIAQSARSKMCGECAKNEGIIDFESEYDSQTSETAYCQTETLPESESVVITPLATETEVVEPPIIEETTCREETPTTDGSSNPQYGIVYWTPNGSVWHADPNCSSLAKSKVVLSGTIEESKKPRGCKRCTDGN